METSSKLNLPYILPGQAQKHVTHNEALRMLDALLQISLISRQSGTPPAAPEAGDRYLVAAPATGEWNRHEHDMAVFQDGAWSFHTPQSGWVAWLEDEAILLVFTGGLWQPLSGASLENISHFGINTTADSTNRLSLKSDAALFSHDDVTPGSGDIRVVLNKSSATGTASLMFQDNWSGRAEIGITGDDHFHFKASRDGSNFRDILVLSTDEISVEAPLRLLFCSISDLPAPDAGGLIYVSDAVGGSVPAFADGSVWRRLDNRAVITSS